MYNILKGLKLMDLMLRALFPPAAGKRVSKPFGA